MKRRPLYSGSTKARTLEAQRWTEAGATRRSQPVYILDPPEPTLRERLGKRWEPFVAQHRTKLVIAASVLITLMLGGAWQMLQPAAQRLTQSDINEAVNFAMDERPRPPSVASMAYAAVIPSVVRVNGYDPAADKSAAETPVPGTPPIENPPPGEVQEDFHEKYTAVGTGVVIDDQGTILTNLHVARAAPRLRVEFFDGTEANAGALAAPDTLARARASGLDPLAMLEDNDAYTLFKTLDDLVVTGPTLTNVNDFRAVLVLASAAA